MLSFSDLILELKRFWSNQGCSILYPYDIPMGAGTFHPMTFFKSVDDKHWKTAYVSFCRRPADGRYAKNPNRLGNYYQFQALLKPSPKDIQNTYLKSLEAIGIDLKSHDVRFVEDNWESPTLGAWGQGWEIWIDGMEVTQFTYFQQVGGFMCNPTPVEITYGLERLAMYTQGVDSVFDILWSHENTYGDMHKRPEYEFSKYNFEIASTDMLLEEFESFITECFKCLKNNLVFPAYDYCLLSSHVFNILDSKKVISATQRQNYILKIRDLTKRCASLYKKGIS